ncbi:MAG: magnesium transporter, partial [Myxococcota bacterium]
GVLIGGLASLIADQPIHGLSIGLSIAVGMFVAATIGSVIPIFLSRLNIDPAVATGPFVTTSVDFFGVLTYFAIATNMTVWLG